MKYDKLYCDNSQVTAVMRQLSHFSLEDLVKINVASGKEMQRKLALHSDNSHAHDNPIAAGNTSADNVEEFLAVIRRIATALETNTSDQMIKQAARGGTLPADYSAQVVLDIVADIEEHYKDSLQSFIGSGKKPVQLVCAFYAGLQSCGVLGNITKARIAEELRHDDTLLKYKVDYLKKVLSPDPAEDWYKDIFLVIEEAINKI